MKCFEFILIATITFMSLLCTDATANPQTHNQLMAERATKALITVKLFEKIDTNEITNLILNENFKEFERRSKIYEGKFLKDPLYESQLNKLYEALDCKNSLLLDKLNKWVTTRPSYISYGVRGIYKVNRGYEIRGMKYIGETPKENIIKMNLLLQEAKTDLLISIKQNKRLSPAYCSLIQIEKASGNIDNIKEIYQIAISSIPETFYVRSTLLTSLQPRWGGSYEQMESYANSMDDAALINPRIWCLKADVPAERAFIAMQNKDYTTAIQYYTEALAYGLRLDVLRSRGRMYVDVKQYDLALKDFMTYRKYEKSNKYVNDHVKYLTESGLVK